MSRWYGFDLSDENLTASKRAVDEGLRLAPELPDASIALAYYHYWGHRDYGAALEALEAARLQEPGNPELTYLTGFVARREGRWDLAATELERALELFPRDARFSRDVGNLMVGLGRLDDAQRLYDRSSELAPDYPDAYASLANLRILRDGDLVAAQAVLDRAVGFVSEEEEEFLWHRFWIDLYRRDFPGAIARIQNSSGRVLDQQNRIVPFDYLLGIAYRAAGDPANARSHFESARTQLEPMLTGDENDYRVERILGQVYAGLGRVDEGIAMSLSTVEGMGARDAWLTGELIGDLATTYTLAGRLDEAVDRVRQLLEAPSPSRPTPALLRLDPRWDPLREHPGFRALLAR